MDKSYLKTKLNHLIKILNNWVVLSLLSSALLILSFPTPGISILSWFALVPLFLIIIRENLGKVVLSSLIVNFVFNFFYLIWLKEYRQPLTFPLSLVAESLYLIPQSILAWLLYRTVPLYFKMFVLAATWVLFDYLKSIGFLAFPWGIIGYTQYKNILLIQSASIFGVWGIDFLILFFILIRAV